MIYLYEDHLGYGFYFAKEELAPVETYCGQCGRSNFITGIFQSPEELGEFLKSKLGVFGCKGYGFDYLNSLYERGCELLEED